MQSAIESATETASTYASEAAESVSESAEAVGEAVGAAAGAYTPREPREDRGGFSDRRGSRFDADKPAPAPSNGVYVGNLLFDVTSADLEREFASFGTIMSATLASDARGLSKG